MTRALFEARGALLRDIMMSEDPREMMLQRLYEIDNTFFAVLSANIQSAQREGRTDVVERLREIGDIAITLLSQTAPPEIHLINRLASAADDAEVRQALEEQRELVDQDLLQLIQQAVEELEEGGRDDSVDRLRYAADQVREMMAA
jgi:hypothetical protein